MKRLILVFVTHIWSHGLFGQNISIPVIEVKQSQCEQTKGNCRLQERIVRQELVHDTLITTIGIIANCGGITKTIAFFHNDTLKFYYTEGKEHLDTSDGIITHTRSAARCNCCFEFTFITGGLKSKPQYTTVEDNIIKQYPDKYKIFPVTFNIINKDTINYTDKYGRRQGKWLYPDEQNMEDPVGDSISFIGYYYHNKLKTCEHRMFYKTGKMAVEKIQTNYHNFSITKYFEDGNISTQWLNYEDKSSIYYNYFPNKTLKYVMIENNNFTEVIEYYESGKIKKICNNLYNKEFYENGQLIKETFNSKENEIWAKFYYDNGNLMAVCYIVKDNKRKWECYDINGKTVTKEYLIEQGFEILAK